MLTIHHLSNSRSQKVLWLAEELGISYSIKKYMRDSNTLAAPAAMKSLHPLGTSPLISENGATYSETGAILDYILRHHGGGRLQPAFDSAEYDQFVEWMHYAEGSAMLPILVTIYTGASDVQGEQLTHLLQAQMAKHLGYIDAALCGVEYLVGNQFSAADIHVSFVAQTAREYTDMSVYTNITSWLERLESRQAYKKAEEKGGHFCAAKVKS
jgi:glutathione S-transferase